MAKAAQAVLEGTIVVETGTVFIADQTVEAVYAIGNTDQALAPVLDLTDAAIRMETLLAALPPGGGPAPGEWGRLHVTGEVDVEATIGRFTPGQGSVPSLYQPGFVIVDLAPGATLGGSFEVRNGAVRFNGEDGAALEDILLAIHGTDVSFVATGHTADLFPVGATATLNAPVTGDSVVRLEAGPEDELGRTSGGSLVIRQAFGAEATLVIEAGTAALSTLEEFEGTVDLIEHDGVVASGIGNTHSGRVTQPMVDQSLFLRDVKATSWSFDDATHTMTLYHGAKAVEEIRFADHITADDFHQASNASDVDAHFVVSAYSNGVDIGSFWQVDAHLLPMHEPGGGLF